jgi:hypothetical protein
MRKLIGLVAVFLIMGTPGCASIVSHTTWPVTFDSAPSGATIKVSDNKGRLLCSGPGPVTLMLKSGDGYFGRPTYYAEASMPGYTSTTQTIRPDLNLWYAGNIAFINGAWVGLLLVDPLTGAMWHLDDRVVLPLNQVATPQYVIVDQTMRDRGNRQQQVIPQTPQEGETKTPPPPQQPIVISDNSSVAVIIGISGYASQGKIRGCDADAKAFAEAFRESRQMNPKNVVLMTDSSDKSHQPTRGTMLSRIETCVKEARPDGIALVYFSGHAVTQDGEALLVAQDCVPGEGIPVSTVVALLQQSPARDKVLIIDVCHANAEQKGVLVMPREPVKGAEGVAMFFSCGEKEYSYLLENGERSVYTDMLLHSLQEDSSASAGVTARSLEAKIEDKMREWRLQTGLRQTPRLELANNADVTLVPKR